jgi:uncharacterized membrane protein
LKTLERFKLLIPSIGEKTNMDLPIMLILAGLLISGIGVLMVLLSLKASPDEVKHNSGGIIFIGPIPIILGGNRKWITMIFFTTVLTVFLIMSFYWLLQ